MSILDVALGRNPSHVSHKLKGDKRLPGESYKSYKKRLREEQRLLENYLEGDMVWCSKAYEEHVFTVDENGNPITYFTENQQLSRGTYVKREQGIIKSDRRAT